MAQAKRKRGGPAQEWPSVANRFKEGVLIIVAAISAFLLLALMTFHQADPSWSHASNRHHILNASGRTGAWISDVLLYMFGYLAYIFPTMMVYGAWLFFRQEKIDSPLKLTALKITGFLFILISGCGLASLYLQNSPHLPFTAGGILGNVIGNQAVFALNSTGGTLILSAFLLTGVTLFTGVSFLQFIDTVGHRTLGVGDKIAEIFQSLNFKALLSRFKRTPRPTIQAPKLLKVAPVLQTKPAEPVKKATSKDRNKALFRPAEHGGKPNLALLSMPEAGNQTGFTEEQLQQLSVDVEARLAEFGIEATVEAILPGPVVTRFELNLAAGTKVSKISALAKDLARALSVVSVRIVEVIPGKPVIGLEVPNIEREVVRLREVLSSKSYEQARSVLSLALGKDIAGHPVIVDLAKMPHLLVAGTTGSGKSVGLNAMLLSLLYKATPDDIRLILIDPKMLELSVYNDIPHLLTPVVTDMKDAANALRWCVAEMERRYRLMASLGVRNIAGYNAKIKDAVKNGAPLLDPLWKPEESVEGQQPELESLPFIVVVVDEFADMMMIVGKKVEELIARIAQKARAAGIHLICATQRPSVDVITGLIKANIPTRIAFQVSSKIDSRTIMDQTGAEQLLGHGDMLYLPPGSGVPVRVHGAFVDDDEINRVCEQLKKEGKPEYLDEVIEGASGDGFSMPGEGGEDPEKDELYDRAVQIVMETRRASISSVQRRLKIGYNRAARIVEAMEAAGLVSAMDSSGAREVLVPAGD